MAATTTSEGRWVGSEVSEEQNGGRMRPAVTERAVLLVSHIHEGLSMGGEDGSYVQLGDAVNH